MAEYRQSVGRRADALRSAFAELFAREFDWSAGHLATLPSGCVFAPSLLTFWFVNGLLDFSTALAIGSVGGPGGLVLRLVAYLLLVPTFLVLRAAYCLAHPVHRETVLSGACPQRDVLSLDWFSVGILATGLPLAVEDLGPWVGMNAVFLVGLFVLPRSVSTRRVELGTKLGAVGLGSALFLYANYGGPVASRVGPVPRPASVLGPVATLTLPPSTVDALLRVTNSILVGPVAVAAVAFAMNRLLTRPELQPVPVVHHSLPCRDPARVVLVSAALGTVFYLAVVAVFGGTLVVVP